MKNINLILGVSILTLASQSAVNATDGFPTEDDLTEVIQQSLITHTAEENSRIAQDEQYARQLDAREKAGHRAWRQSQQTVGAPLTPQPVSQQQPYGANDASQAIQDLWNTQKEEINSGI